MMGKHYISGELGGLFSVEYCAKQDKLHIDNVERALSMNVEVWIPVVNWDWRLVGLFKTYKEASDYCAYLRETYDIAIYNLEDE